MIKSDGIFALNISNKYLIDMLNICQQNGFKEIDRLYLSYRKKFNKESTEPIIIMKKA